VLWWHACLWWLSTLSQGACGPHRGKRELCAVCDTVLGRHQIGNLETASICGVTLFEDRRRSLQQRVRQRLHKIVSFLGRIIIGEGPRKGRGNWGCDWHGVTLRNASIVDIVTCDTKRQCVRSLRLSLWSLVGVSFYSSRSSEF